MMHQFIDSKNKRLMMISDAKPEDLRKPLSRHLSESDASIAVENARKISETF